MNNKRTIKVKGARQNNLKNIDVTIEKNKITVFTGPSGAGKSSFVFDTLFAESQRSFIESLSTYVRQIIKIKSKPDFDSMEGLSPSIVIDQNSQHRSSKATLATLTELHDFFRLLFAKISKLYSSETNEEIIVNTKSEIRDLILKEFKNEKICIFCDCTKSFSNSKSFAEYALKSGFMKTFDVENYKVLELEEIKDNKIKLSLPYNILIDRLAVNEEISCKERIISSLDSALEVNKSTIMVASTDKKYIKHYHMSYEAFGINVPQQLSPRSFSFNTPEGACQACKGMGIETKIDPYFLIIDSRSSLLENLFGEEECLSAKEEGRSNQIKAMRPQDRGLVQKYLQALSKKLNFSLNQRWDMIDEAIQKEILYGDGNSETISLKKILEIFDQKYHWSQYKTEANCDACLGTRLNKDILQFKIMNMNIADVVSMTVSDALKWIKKLQGFLKGNDEKLAREILLKINKKINTLSNIGLDYLELDRRISTLSNGEIQRVRVASQIGTGLNDIIYILDEPSIGLHKHDNAKLLKSILALRDLQNTIVIVEHDEDTIELADYVVDIGPMAGQKGGYIIAEGTPSEIKKNPKSITGKYLNKTYICSEVIKRRAIDSSTKYIKIKNLTKNNFKNLSVSFPLSKLVCITGVSGSGKSTLIMDVLKNTASRYIKNKSGFLLPCQNFEINGLEFIDQVIEIDQLPIGKTPRSNPATYIGVFDQIRNWMASLPQAKIRGYNATHFSFNTPQGRCEKCEGHGIIKVAMHFLPDVYVKCDSCNGKRYNNEILDVKYKNKDIGDILLMTTSEALEFFSEMQLIVEKLKMLEKIGLSYLPIGQAANTLSGGESQRVKIAKELSKKSTGQTLYILDEPTTGLHPCDISNLINTINALVDMGNTVIVIEHNMDLIKASDYIIDIGPGAGAKGGKVVATGIPEDICLSKESITGFYLKDLFNNKVETSE